MPRIRQIRPEFWSDEKVTRLSVAARLALIALWNFADDHGRARAYPRELAGFAFPTDDLDIAPLLEEIARSGIVHFYVADGLPLYHLPNWRKHQKVDRLLPSRLPDPANHCGACLVAAGPEVLAEVQVVASVPVATTRKSPPDTSSGPSLIEPGTRPCTNQEHVPDSSSASALGGNRNLEIGNRNLEPDSEAEPAELTAAQRDKLLPLLHGTMFFPKDVPSRILATIAKKGATRRGGMAVYQAAQVLAEDRDRYVTWLVEALRRAKTNAKPSMLLDYAAGVVARALESGEDLAKVTPIEAVSEPAGPAPAWKEVW